MGFKSSERVPESADVVVVGCGITGANAARFLTEQSPELDVVVLEAREVCWGATGRVRDFSSCCCLIEASSLHVLFPYFKMGRNQSWSLY